MSICMSPNDPETAILNTTNCSIKLWKITSKKFDISKKYMASCGKCFNNTCINSTYPSNLFISIIVTFSPKGKQIVAYLDDHVLIYLDGTTLEESKRINLPIDPTLNLTANDICWFSNKQYFISLSSQSEETESINIFYVEINFKESKCTKCVDFTQLIFPGPDAQLFATSYFKQIVEWLVNDLKYSKKKTNNFFYSLNILFIN